MTIVEAAATTREAASYRTRIDEAKERRDDARADERAAARRRASAERELAHARAEERRAHRFDSYA